MDSEVLLWNTCIYLSDRDLYSLSKTCKSVYVITQHARSWPHLWLARCEQVLHTKLDTGLTDNWHAMHRDLVGLDRKTATTVTNELSILCYLDAYNVNRSTEGAFVLALCLREGYTRALRRFASPEDGPWGDADVRLAFADSIKRGHIAVVQFLAEQKRVNSLSYNNVAELAASYGQVAVVQFVLDLSGHDVVIVQNCLIRAVIYGHADLVSLLLQDKRVSPPYVCLLPNIPCAKNAPEITQALLSDPRFDPTYMGHLSIRATYLRGDRVLMEQLCSDPRVTEEVKTQYSIDKRDRYVFAFQATLVLGGAYLLYRAWKD